MQRWGVSLWALGCALLAGTTATAQVIVAPIPPVHPQVDGNGVDLITGQFLINSQQVSVGRGAGALSRAYKGVAGSDNFYGEVTVNGSVYTVNMATSAESFTYSGSPAAAVFTNNQSSGSTLTGVLPHYDQSTGDFASPGQYDFSYTMRDGSVAAFQNINNSPNYVARLVRLTKPTGEVLTYSYEIYPGAASTGDVYLNGVSSNYGYSIDYTLSAYNPSAPVSPTNYTGVDLKITAVNNRIDAPCPGGGCSYSQAWDAVSYTSPNLTTAGDSFLDPLGRQTTFGTTTNPAPSLTRKTTSPSGNSYTITYDTSVAPNRVLSYATAAGTWNYSYADNGSTRTTTVTDPNGHINTIVSNTTLDVITSFTDAMSRVTSYGYDGYGRVTSITTPHGDVTTYTYDENETSARGNITTTTWTPAGGGAAIVTHASYDANCTYPAKCNKPNSTTDGRGAQTTYTYDNATGVVLTVTKPAGVNGVQPQTRYSYTWEQANYKNFAGTTTAGPAIYLLTGISTCATGSAPSCVGTADETFTAITYDPNQNLAPVSVRVAAGNGSVSSTQSFGYDVFGNQTSVANPLGGVTTYVYDADRELTGLISPDPDGSGPRTPAAAKLAYTADGKVSTAQTGSVSSQADTGFSSFTLATYKSYNYDGVDRLVSEYDGQVANGGLGPAYAETDYQYDAANRLICTATRLNVASFGTAAACTQTAAGANGPDQITYRSYSADNSLQQVVTGYATSAQRADASYAYNADGTLAHVQDANGNVTCYGYDGFGRAASANYPNPAQAGACNGADYESYGYDANGNLVSRRLRDGSVLSYTYDALNHMTADSLGDAFSYDNLGQVRTGAYGGRNLALGYDALGRMTSQTTSLGTIASAYDAAGDRVQLTWPDGFYVNYTYDLTSALTAVEESGATSGVGLLASYGFDNFGRPTSAAFAGSATTLGEGISYDSASRASLLGYTYADSTKNDYLGLTYSAASQVLTKTHTNDLFDAATSTGVAQTYSVNGLNQITAAGSYSFSYDGRGNLTSDGLNSYQYDGFNHMTSGPNLQLAYDAAGRLAQTTNASGAVTQYLYDGQALIGEYDGSGNLLRRYVHGTGVDTPLVWYEGGAGTSDRRWLMADDQGSIVAVANASGQALGIDSYDPYGLPGATNLGRFQYTGQAWLPEAGLYYYKARIYSPALGRFMQTDPIGYGDGLNWYAYAHGDPIDGADPSGTVFTKIYGNVSYTAGPQFDSGPDGGLSDGLWSGSARPDVASSGGGGNNVIDYIYAVKEVPVTGNKQQQIPIQPSNIFGNSYGSTQNDIAICGWSCTPEQAAQRRRERQADIDNSWLAVPALAPVAVPAAAEASAVVAEVVVDAADALGPAGNIIGRQRLGGSSIFNINSNDYLRFGWGWKGSGTNGRSVIRISGKVLDAVLRKSRSHIDLWPF